MFDERSKSMEQWSKHIDRVIEEEKALKASLPNHKRFTPIRMELDLKIKSLRALKKEAMTYWRELKRNPQITP